MKIAFDVAERVGVIPQAMLYEIVGAQRHIEGQVFLHVRGDLRILQSRAIAAGEFPGEGLDVAVELLIGNDLGNQPDTLCFDAGQISSGERNVESLLERNAGMRSGLGKESP